LKSKLTIFGYPLSLDKLLDLSFVVSGETLQDERINGGAFIGSDGVQFPHKLIPVSFGLFFYHSFELH